MKVKRLLLYAAALCGLLSVLIPVGFDQARHNWQRRMDPERLLPEVMQEIRSNGISSRVSELLVVGRQRADTWAVAYVVEGDPMFGAYGQVAPAEQAKAPVILAASSPELVGKLRQYALTGIPGPGYSMATTLLAPNGKPYTVFIAMANDPLPLWVRAKAQVWPVTIAVALAWLALAAWIYLDAREKGSAAPAWLLLGLLTGPVALAVWLIYTYTQGSFPAPKPCPGCGADTVRGTAFCVRCGFALRPACPDCRRPVEVDWVHCGACGRSLSE
jgi:hypothetical protein